MRLIAVLKISACILLSYSIYASPIHEARSITIGGISQWIKMDGDDNQNPVLLFLHGGPGNSVMKYADRFTKELQKKFIVVEWDQRETGKTKSLNRSSKPLTVQQFESDAVELIDYLRDHFKCDKIYLVGHSWGGFLALQVAIHHPELLLACFAASPMVHQTQSEIMSLEKMKEAAIQQKNRSALIELAQVKIPFENGSQLYYHRKWLYQLLNHQRSPFTKSYVESWSSVWLPLFNEASSINFFETAIEIKCPAYFLLGSNDYQTNSGLTKRFFEKLKAEKKELFWFTDSAHVLNLTEPEKFQDVIISSALQLNH